MNTRRFTIPCIATLAILAATASPVSALPTQVVHMDTPQCDPLFIPTNVDEIGDLNIFPPDERLSHQDRGMANPVCTATDIPGMPDFLVEIVNLTGRDFQEVWYVADDETNVTNFDGEANDISFPPLTEAFRIDRLASDPGGSHHPLTLEDMTQDGIWENGETWQFVLQDYINTLGLPPDAITSPGVGTASMNTMGFVASSGSIITIPPSTVTPAVPEPSSAMMALIGLASLGVINRRRRNRN